MNVVLVTAEELAAGRVVLPPKVVKGKPDDIAWEYRTVSQTLEESQCPDCGGLGGARTVVNIMEATSAVQHCPTCDGRGSLVRLHLAIEQRRHELGGQWFEWHDPSDDEDDEGCTSASESYPTERRQAIVGYVTPTRPCSPSSGGMTRPQAPTRARS